MTERTAEVAEQYETASRTWRRHEGALGAVTTALAARTGSLPAGSTLLDVACGAGEPGLSLLAAAPGVHLVGVDVAPSMVAAAQEAAAVRDEHLARFEVAAAEDLPLPDATVAAVVSRMGMLAFPGAGVRTAQEAFRVLEPGGRLAIATWGALADHVALDVVVAASRHVLGPDAADLGWMDELADGRRDRWLREAGFVHVVAETLPCPMRFADADEFWQRARTAGPLAATLGALTGPAEQAARAYATARLEQHRQDDGDYLLPATATVLTAVRPVAPTHP